MPQPLDFISVPHARVMSISVATVIAAIFIVATVRLSSGKSGFVWLIKNIGILLVDAKKMQLIRLGIGHVSGSCRHN